MEPLVEVSVGRDCLLSDCGWCFGCRVKTYVVYPAGEMDSWMLGLPGLESGSQNHLSQ